MKEETVVDRICAACPSPVTGRPDKRYCSTQCRARANRADRHAATLREGARLAETRVPCPVCGEDFAPAVKRSTGGYAKRKFCSPRCRIVENGRRNYSSAVGKQRRERNAAEGITAAYSARARARLRVLEEIECWACSTPFERTKGTTRILCGDPRCQSAYDLDRCHRRNAMIRDATVEAVSRIKVFDRDGWVCGICETPVDPEAPPRSPGSASLDHIVPLSRGGEHSMRNVQCAHLRCNQSKSDRAEGRYIAVTGDRI